MPGCGRTPLFVKLAEPPIELDERLRKLDEGLIKLDGPLVELDETLYRPSIDPSM